MPLPLRVLIVEDRPTDAELVVREIRRAGFEPDWHRVETEEDYIASLHPDLDIILSDFEMPHFSGTRALEQLRSSGLEIPFILVSGTIGEDTAVAAMKCGATDYLLKDRLGRLGAAIEHALEERRLKAERRQAALALRESEERFRQVVENIQEVFWLTDANKEQMLYISPAYETIWGRTCAELYANSRTWVDAIHPEDRERVLRSAITNQVSGSYDEEFRVVRPDGSVRWIRDRAFLVLSAANEAPRVAGVARDITGKKLAEERIREQAALLDHARDAIIVFGLNGEIHFWNRSATRLFGWGSDALGCEIQSLIFPDVTVFQTALEVVLSKGGWIGEIAMQTLNAVDVLVESRWTLVRDAEGAPRSILSINTDITERKKLEAQFFRAQRLESIGMLAGGIAHDLNNILGPILMSAELLRMHRALPPDPQLLETIEVSASRGAEMVKHVLSFARGIEGRYVSVRPNDLFIELKKITREAFPKSITVRASAPTSVWNITGDPTQLHQVLLNLAVNARDAMSTGGTLTLTARNVEIDAQFAAMQTGARPGHHVVLEVADTGPGIPAEYLERIFDPFFTTKEPGKGTGLGLSTCTAIVKSHGGFLTVKSNPGEGTVFSIHLPANPDAGEENVTTEASELPRGSGEIILIIDDEAALRSITRQTLETFGYRVMTAADGAEGVAIFAQHAARITLVLTDLQMPVMDGVAAARAILRLDPTAKIIGATGLAAKNPETAFASAGVQYFLPKPYTADTMLKMIHGILRRGEAPQI